VITAMFNERQIEQLYEYDLRPQLSGAARERFLDEARPFDGRRAALVAAFRVSLKELLKPGVFEEICRISARGGVENC